MNRLMHIVLNLLQYFLIYASEYEKRYGKPIKQDTYIEFEMFVGTYQYVDKIFEDWHDYGYLRVCMTNLYEKAKYGKGNSKITDEEWDWLFYGYSVITGGEEYYI